MREDLDEPSVESGAASASILVRYGLTPWDATAVAAVILLVVAFVPPLYFDAWTPRMALLLGFGAPGLVVLARSAMHGSVAARLLVAALAWAWLSALVSGAFRSSAIGFVGRDLSALTITLSAGCWALGTKVSERGRTVVAEVFVYASSFAAVVGLLQVVASVEVGALALQSGRPTSFLTNPVYFGAICSSGAITGLALWERTTWNRLLAPVVLLAAGVSLSGSRVALASTVLVVVLMSALDRRIFKLVGAAAVVGALALGVGIDRVFGAGGNAASRLGQTDGGAGGRAQVWRYGLEAWLDRPVFGYGFGRFRPAVQERFSASFVRDFAPDDVTQAWFDAHNVLVGTLVSVGLVGTVLVLGWTVVWARGIRGALAWALVPIVLHWLMQPVSLFTLPLAMLLFGAARARQVNDSPRPSSGADRIWTATGGVLGACLALGLVAADVSVTRAVDRLDGPAAASVASAMFDDAVIGDVTAQVYSASETGSSTDALRWRRRVADVEPDRPYWWTTLAQSELAAGNHEAAEAAIVRSLELQPYNVRTNVAAATVAREIGDDEMFADQMDRLCVLGFDEACDLENRIEVP